MTDASTTLAEFLAAVAAKQPAPGGGAVSAVVGALSAAIGEMALNYSVGKKGLEAHQPALNESLRRLSAARNLMLRLMVEDQLAFETAQSLKKQNAAADTLAAAALVAIRVPQSVAATAAAILDETARVAPIANRWLLSDLAVCAELAMATVRCGICNVRVNLADVPDASERQNFMKWCEDLMTRCTKTIRQVIPENWKRIEQP